MPDTYPNGEPPNLRIVECCNTCKHVECGYEGERSCKKYPVLYDWSDPDYSPQPSYVEQNNICDGYEPHARQPEKGEAAGFLGNGVTDAR